MLGELDDMMTAWMSAGAQLTVGATIVVAALVFIVHAVVMGRRR